MDRYLGKYSPYAFALLRIVSGLLFACHGGQKIFGMFGGTAQALGSLPGAAGLIELIGGFFIAVGLFGSYAAFICSGQMAVAYFMAHGLHAFFPIVNKGELAVMYCFVFLYIAIHGSGILSVDQLIGRSTSRPEFR